MCRGHAQNPALAPGSSVAVGLFWPLCIFCPECAPALLAGSWCFQPQPVSLHFLAGRAACPRAKPCSTAARVAAADSEPACPLCVWLGVVRSAWDLGSAPSPQAPAAFLPLNKLTCSGTSAGLVSPLCADHASDFSSGQILLCSRRAASNVACRGDVSAPP